RRACPATASWLPCPEVVGQRGVEVRGGLHRSGVQPGNPRWDRAIGHEPCAGGRAVEEDDLVAGRCQGEGFLEPRRKIANVNSRGHAETPSPSLYRHLTNSPNQGKKGSLHLENLNRHHFSH